MKKEKFAVIDLEATGMGESHHRIIEVAIVILELENGRLELRDHFESLVNPDTQLPKKIQELTGIRESELLVSPRFVDIAPMIELYTRDAVIVAHGAAQDFELLQNHFEQVGIDYRRRYLCTLNLARENDPELALYDLKSLCNLYDIDHRHHHRALPDAMACATLFARIYNGPRRSLSHELGFLFKLLQKYPMISHAEIEALDQAAGVLFLYKGNKIVAIHPYEKGREELVKLLLRLPSQSFDKLTTKNYDHYLLALIDALKLQKRFRPKLFLLPKLRKIDHESYPQTHFQLDLQTSGANQFSLVFRDGRFQGVIKNQQLKHERESKALKNALLHYLRTAKNAKVRTYGLKTLKNNQKAL